MTSDSRPGIAHSDRQAAKVLQVIVYAHSGLFYWWPLWVVGYAMALLTWLHHERTIVGNKPEWFHPSRNPGVIYTLLLLLLILVTSAKIKGKKGVVTIVVLAFFTLLFAHLNWWDAILIWLGNQSISMSFGFYLFSSSALSLLWLISVFVVDHLSFWRFRPGQVTHEFLGGIVDKSYDTDNMILFKQQDDLFRHWVIGLGSGDLHMQTMGGEGVEMNVVNVLFVIGKISRIQRLIATKPDVPEQA